MSTVIQSAFTGGEIAPTLAARTDLSQYANSLAEMHNFYPQLHGGASNRQGTIYVNEVKYSAKRTRVYAFQFSVTQLYFLEIGDRYIRVYMNGGIVTSAGSPVEITTPFLEADLFKLKFKQSADKLYIRHPSYPRYELTRSSHTSWTLSTPTTGSSISAPGAITRSSGTATGHYYAVTAVSATGEETPTSAQTTSMGFNDVLTWAAITGASYYNLYETVNQAVNGSYGWLARANSNTITVPNNLAPEASKGAPVARSMFTGAGDYPGCCGFYEQRLYEARTNNNPQTLFGSRTGSTYNNFNISVPLRNDDAVTFTLDSEQVNEIRWMAMLGNMLIGTAGGEWRAKHGTNSDSITPSSIDLKQQSAWGCDDLRPLIVGKSILFHDVTRQTVRSLFPSPTSLESEYDSTDLTILAKHLFLQEDDDTANGIIDWTYQQSPNSTVWCCRDDGVLLGNTYHQEHKINAWHWHDTDGAFESTASAMGVSASNDVYFIIRRLINGSYKRYVERFAPRAFADIRTAWFVDCGLQINIPLNITGITKASPGVVTVTAHGLSNGNQIIINDLVGMGPLNQFYFKVANVTTNTFTLTDLYGTPINTTAYPAYSSGGTVRKCFTTISNLGYLEGKTVAILADGNYVAGKVVTGGAITLDTPAGLATVGLPYTADIETLDLDYQTPTGPLADKMRKVESVLLKLKKSRACWVGPDIYNLQEVKFRTNEANGVPTALYTSDKDGGKEVLLYPPDNLRTSRVHIQVREPLPLTVQAIMARIVDGQK